VLLSTAIPWGLLNNAILFVPSVLPGLPADPANVMMVRYGILTVRDAGGELVALPYAL